MKWSASIFSESEIGEACLSYKALYKPNYQVDDEGRFSPIKIPVTNASTGEMQVIYPLLHLLHKSVLPERRNNCLSYYSY